MIRRNIHLFVTIFVFLMLNSCDAINGSSIEIPDKTPVSWRIDGLEGHGRAFLEGNLLYGFTLDDNKIKIVDLDKHEVIWQNDKVLGFHSWDTWALLYKDYLFAWYDGYGVQIYKPDSSTKPLKTLVPPNGDEFLDGGYIAATILIKNDRLYVINHDMLFVYDLKDPENPGLLWQYQGTDIIFTLEVDDFGDVYTGIQITGKEVTNLYKLSALDGSVLWSTNTYYSDAEFQRGKQWSTALRLEGNVLYAAVPVTVQAFDTKTGSRLWVSGEYDATCTLGAGDIDAFTSDKNSLYVTPAYGSCVHTFNKLTGKLVWTATTAKAPNPDNFTDFGGRPLLHQDILYAANTALWAFNSHNGEVLSISKDFNNSQNGYVQYYNGEILVWGDKLMAYKPIK